MISSFFSLNLYFQQRAAHDKLDIHTFPYVIGDWKGEDLEITQKEYDILETKNLISREYISPSGEKVYLFIIYSETNRRVFHPPEVCMMGGGIKIVDKRSAVINSSGYKFSVNKLYTQKDSYRGMALYCYKAGNLYTDNFYLQQAYFSLNQLLGKHRGGATIRVSMPITKDEQRFFETLKEFMVEAVKIIDSLPSQSTL
jgi:EpsI family protein